MALQTAIPQRSAASECALQERLEHFVNQRTSGMVRHLNVRVDRAEVTLTGLAPNYYTKQLATHAVLDSVDGVALTNEIEVV